MRNSIPVLRLELRRSLWLASLLLITHAGAFVLVIVIPLLYWVKILLAGLIGISLTTSLRNYALLRGRRAIVSALWDSDNQWMLRNAAGREFEASLLPGCYVNPALVILNFSAGSRWRYHTLVLMPDVLDAATLRQLRVRLLHPPARDPQNSAV